MILENSKFNYLSDNERNINDENNFYVIFIKIILVI